jgi:hypothetical protein
MTVKEFGDDSFVCEECESTALTKLSSPNSLTVICQSAGVQGQFTVIDAI